MKTNNPSSDPEISARIGQKLKGRAMALRAGNGWGFTKWQLILNEALKLENLSTELEFPVPFHHHIPAEGEPPPPKCHMIDIALPLLKIAIEVDGYSHMSRKQKQRDGWKTRRLNEQGWIVLRFWNGQVERHTATCVQTVLSTISKLRETTITLPMAS
jgi:hypothetical protein